MPSTLLHTCTTVIFGCSAAKLDPST